jgi:hypothetical protein
MFKNSSSVAANTGGHFALGIVNTGGKFAPVATTPPSTGKFCK